MDGASKFLSWLDWELGLTKGNIKPAPPSREEVKNLRKIFTICENANEMRNRIKDLYKYDKNCRLLAGYSWKWISKENENLIDSQSRRSNLNLCFNWVNARKQREFNLGLTPYNNELILFGEGNSIPATAAYPLTVRGCDFTHTGILWGQDLVWRKNQWTIQLDYIYGTDNKSWYNKAIKEIISGKLDGKGIKRLIYARACAYRILLTRAMETVRLWFEDDETREHLINSWNAFLTSQNSVNDLQEGVKTIINNRKNLKNKTKQTSLLDFNKK